MIQTKGGPDSAQTLPGPNAHGSATRSDVNAMGKSTHRVVVPGKRPHNICGQAHRIAFCSRPQGHTGRHAWIWWGMGGVVRAVWDGTHEREVTHGS